MGRLASDPTSAEEEHDGGALVLRRVVAGRIEAVDQEFALGGRLENFGGGPGDGERSFLGRGGES